MKGYCGGVEDIAVLINSTRRTPLRWVVPERLGISLVTCYVEPEQVDNVEVPQPARSRDARQDVDARAWGWSRLQQQLLRSTNADDTQLAKVLILKSAITFVDTPS
jgi:hypothetical protein